MNVILRYVLKMLSSALKAYSNWAIRMGRGIARVIYGGGSPRARTLLVAPPQPAYSGPRSPQYTGRAFR